MGKDTNGRKGALVENAAGAVGGTACGPGAVVLAAGGATDAAAMTGALATLGGGSMLLGFGAVAALGILGFLKWTVPKLMS